MSMESKLIARRISERALRLWVESGESSIAFNLDDVPEEYVSRARREVERELRDLHQKDCSDG
jgi:hypothetical protein